MSQTVIFSVGIVVFALTVWGAVMAGGIWLGQLAEPEDTRVPETPVTDDRDPNSPPHSPKPRTTPPWNQ